MRENVNENPHEVDAEKASHVHMKVCSHEQDDVTCCNEFFVISRKSFSIVSDFLSRPLHSALINDE